MPFRAGSSCNQDQSAHRSHTRRRSLIGFSADSVHRPAGSLHELRYVDAETRHGRPGVVRIPACPSLAHHLANPLIPAKKLFAGTAGIASGFPIPFTNGRLFHIGGDLVQQPEYFPALVGEEDL